jgi:hypothetical protein
MTGDEPLPAHWFAADNIARRISADWQREEAANRKLFVPATFAGQEAHPSPPTRT